MPVMTVPDTPLPSQASPPVGRESPDARARRIEELKRQVQAGTYLIQRYEIIEGILDSLSQDPD
jgi:anti-sigma28 factor (negative regulator of flagellin synthesis)